MINYCPNDQYYLCSVGGGTSLNILNGKVLISLIRIRQGNCQLTLHHTGKKITPY